MDRELGANLNVSETPKLFLIENTVFEQKIEPGIAQAAAESLEQGNVIYLPNLNFHMSDAEQLLLNENVVKATSKNVSFNPNTDQLKGYATEQEETLCLHKMKQRYAALSTELIKQIIPQYQADFRIGRTSYRPKEAKERVSPSQRKDDRLLHIDAFPSQPVKDRRILRIFTNVNPENKSRIWRLGTAFSKVVDNFHRQIRRKYIFESEIMQLLKITKSKRTLYDHAMLELHNHMKNNSDWQKDSPQDVYTFPSGATWIVYTDIVSHAVIEGQYVFEQTFYPNLSTMVLPEFAPQTILAKKYGISIQKIVQ